MSRTQDKTGMAIPAHVGIIMDGNGRWATQRNLQRTSGHREGLKTAKRIVKAASEIGIKYITLYVFSTENWQRAAGEVSFLMRLIRTHLKKEYEFYRKNFIRVVHSGNIIGLPLDVQREIRTVTEATSHFTGLTVNLAINYGGRDEIVRAFNRLLEGRLNAGGGLDSVTSADVAANLDCPELPETDLIIRTGGEKRTSNFLIWESAYAELYFSGKLWPDWDRDDLIEAIRDYAARDRRFGKT